MGGAGGLASEKNNALGNIHTGLWGELPFLSPLPNSTVNLDGHLNHFLQGTKSTNPSELVLQRVGQALPKMVSEG